MTILPEEIDPVMRSILDTTRGGELAVKMGIEFLELSATHSVARMPVVGNTQVLSLIHI